MSDERQALADEVFDIAWRAQQANASLAYDPETSGDYLRMAQNANSALEAVIDAVLYYVSDDE